MVKRTVSAMFGLATAAVALCGAAKADDIESKVQMCVACHGQNGLPINAATPIIWGQQSIWLYKELHDYHSGDRSSAIMAPIAKAFSLDDLRQIANYFAAKPWPAAGAATAPAASATAASAAAALPSAPEGSAMCRACHGKNFEGGAPAPRLAGLSYDYLIGQMNAFADGTRSNNNDMPGFMKALTQAQREAIARYLSAL